MYTYLRYWVARSRAHTDRVEYYPMMDSVCVCVCVFCVCVRMCMFVCVYVWRDERGHIKKKGDGCVNNTHTHTHTHNTRIPKSFWTMRWCRNSQHFRLYVCVCLCTCVFVCVGFCHSFHSFISYNIWQATHTHTQKALETIKYMCAYICYKKQSTYTHTHTHTHTHTYTYIHKTYVVRECKTDRLVPELQV